jgi:plastin-1
LLQWVGVLGVVGGAVNFEDVGDYMSILRLFHAVAPGSVDWKKVKEKPKNHFEQLEGCAYMLHVAKNMLKLQIVSFGAKDILQKNRKYILGNKHFAFFFFFVFPSVFLSEQFFLFLSTAILWQVMRYHMLQILKKLSKKGKEMTEQDLVQWANQKVESIGFPTKIASLKEKHLGDGIFLAHLVAALYPKHINLNLLYTNPATIKEKKENCVYVLSVARKIGCIVFLLWEDMLEVNQKMMFTFIATLYTHYAEHSTL